MSTVSESTRQAEDFTEVSQTSSSAEKITVTESTPQEAEKLDVESSAVENAVPPTETLSRRRKILVLFIVCLAQFFDIFNGNASIISLPELGRDLGFEPGALQWILSAYTLTFASFMLISGSVSDIFHPKPVFCAGFAVVGLFAIPVGASVHPIMAIVFRALQGIGAAMNVPSSLAMIRIAYQDPVEQNHAYAWYASAGAIGNVLGFIIGGVLTARTTWRWVHYLIAIAVIPTSIVAWFILPNPVPKTDKRRSIDLPGVLTLTAGLILFVYAISASSDSGWGSPQVITTLVLSVVVMGAFFGVEKVVKEPALPLQTWTNKNFIPLFFYGWTAYWWLLGMELQLVDVFTQLWHDSSLIAAVRCIPLGPSGVLSCYLAGKYITKAPHTLLIGGPTLMAVASILFALGDTPDKYWSHIFTGLIIGHMGMGGVYVGCTTMIMSGAREGEEGVVGAVTYTAYQMGATLGLAVVSSITLGVNSGRALDPISQHAGYAASFWSLLGVNGFAMIVAIFFREPFSATRDDISDRKHTRPEYFPTKLKAGSLLLNIATMNS
ncbi:hypothetical protein EYR40_001646 [Pleurotus pulmonarius]|nr:hypothetical protein EYR40_001646 [Pleurotus pulmonarius]